MRKSILLVSTLTFLLSCKTTTYFVVRHAEKAENIMASDVPLSEAGEKRAQALRERLKHKGIGTVYSTDYQRTKATAQPLADEVGVTIQVYDPRDSTFVRRIVNAGHDDDEGNMLIVGHSNTVDDIVNELAGDTVVHGDLPESRYGDLFIIKKKGKKFIFRQEHFGQ